MFDRAAAAARQGLRFRHPDFVFVEQPPEQVFKRQRCVRQFIVRHRLAQQADMLPIRMTLPHMPPLPPAPPLRHTLATHPARHTPRPPPAPPPPPPHPRPPPPPPHPP